MVKFDDFGRLCGTADAKTRAAADWPELCEGREHFFDHGQAPFPRAIVLATSTLILSRAEFQYRDVLIVVYGRKKRGER